MPRKTVELGSLWRGRVFYLGSRKFKVADNLGVAGVAVQSLAQHERQIGDRKFKVTSNTEQVWSAGSEVEIEVRS